MQDGEAAAEGEGVFSVGEYLKAQRTIRGIALEDLASRTRIPLRSLTLLEAGEFDGDPDGFVRGFVRTVSEGLGLDPDDTLMRMLQEPPVGESARTRLAASLPMGWVLLACGGAALIALLFALAGAVTLVPADEVHRVVIRRDPVQALAAAHAASSFETPARARREGPAQAPTRPETTAAR